MEKIILLVLSVIMIGGCTQMTMLNMKSEDITTFSLSWYQTEKSNWTLICNKCQKNKTFCEQGFNYTLLMKLPEVIDRVNCKMLYKYIEYPQEEDQFFSMSEENVDKPGSFNLSLDENNEVLICCGLGSEYKQACRISTLPAKCTK